MSINLKMPDITELKPRITVFGVGGAGCNAVNNMIEAGLQGVEFVVANTDAQALTLTKADRLIQMGVAVTQGLGAGSQPEIGRAAAEETIEYRRQTEERNYTVETVPQQRVEKRTTIETVPAAPVVEKRTTVETVPAPQVIEKKVETRETVE